MQKPHDPFNEDSDPELIAARAEWSAKEARAAAVPSLHPLNTGTAASRHFTLHDLDVRRIKLESPPDKPVPIITLQGQQVCTAGNLTVLAAQVKSGKSAAVGAIIAATLAADNANDEADTFGFAGRPTEGKAVIHFDTEQSPYDAWQLIHRAYTRAGAAHLPAIYRAYSLCDIPTATRRAFLSQEMERAAEECGGIHSVTIDGIADLVRDPNDPDEAFGLVGELHQLAVRYACPIISVIHENPSTTGGSKTRGHLGSDLERKAESNLRLVKSAEISTIFSERCRSANLPQAHGAKFKWCDQAGMHVTVEADTADQADENKRKAEQPACDAVFEGVVGAIKWGDLKGRIMGVATLTSPTAERRIRLWEKLGLIRKSKLGGYAKNGVSDEEPSTIMEPSNDHQ